MNTTCHFHPDRDSVGRCARCEQPSCADCLDSSGRECLSCSRPPVRSTRVELRSVLATRALIAMNLAVAAWGYAKDRSFDSPSLNRDYALYLPAVRDGEWYRLITSGFLHLGLLHLLFNMLALNQLGHTLEEGISARRFVGIYLVSMLAGSAGALLMSPDDFTAGASGGVFGLAAAATYALAKRGVRFSQTGWGPVLVMNLLFTFGAAGISIGGHLGGLVGGLACAVLILRPREAPTEPGSRGDPFMMRDTAVLAGLGALAAGVCVWAAGRGAPLSAALVALAVPGATR